MKRDEPRQMPPVPAEMECLMCGRREPNPHAPLKGPPAWMMVQLQHGGLTFVFCVCSCSKPPRDASPAKREAMLAVIVAAAHASISGPAGDAEDQGLKA